MASSKSYIFTHTVFLLIISACFTVSLLTSIKYKWFSTISKLYSLPISFIIGSYLGSLLISFIGYISACTNNKIWMYTYSIYMSIPMLLFMYDLHLINRRDSFSDNQMVFYYGFDNFSAQLLSIENNLSCCGYNNQDYNTTKCIPSLETCTNAAHILTKDLSNKIKIISIIAISTFLIHIIETVCRAIYSDESLIDQSGSSVFLRRFVD